MKPSQYPRQVASSADALAADLATSMISYIASLYENAPEEDRLDLILRYGPTLHMQQRTVNKAARYGRRTYEQKGE